MANFEAKVSAVLDSAAFEAQMANLTKPREIKITAKSDSFDKSMDKLSNGSKTVDVKINAKNVDKEAERIKKQLEKATNTEIKSSTLSNNMETWLNKNTEAAKVYGDTIKELQNQLEHNTDTSNLQRISLEFAKVKSEAQAAGLVTNTFSQSLKNFGLQALGLTSGIAAFRKAVQTVKQMAQETIKVDTAMTELYRVTNLSESQYSKLYDNMTKSAKAYGAELDTMINSTASWVRLGFDANTANKLAEVSTMYQHVTDLDEKTAVNNLVTAYMGFKDSLLEVTNGDEVAAITRISDVFDKLGRHNCP